MPKEYRTIQEVAGPLMLVKGVESVTYDELAEIELANGEMRRCKVLEINGGNALVQLFESSTGINLSNSKRALPRQNDGTWPYREDMLGRVFDGLGRPIDGGPEILPDRRDGHQRSADEPGGPQLPAGIHPDRCFRHRRSEHPGARPEAADLLRLRSAPCQACRTDRPSGKGARRRTTQFAVVFAAMGITFEESNFFIERLHARPAPSTARSCSSTLPTTRPSSVSQHPVWR